MSINRETRLARQERDSGHADDEVLVTTGTHTECYHERETCHNVDLDNIERMTRHEAKLRWKGPCLNCVIDGGKP